MVNEFIVAVFVCYWRCCCSADARNRQQEESHESIKTDFNRFAPKGFPLSQNSNPDLI